MTAKKTMREREQELQALMQTPAGQAELERLASDYAEDRSGPSRGTSVITFILVSERVAGVIEG
jgi:hypothetical protein